MLGPTEDALQAPDGALRGEDMKTVYRSEVRLLRLVNALLDFSRIEAGRTQALFEPVDVSEVTADLAGVFRSAIERAGLRLERADRERAAEAGFAAHPVKPVDIDHLEQVLRRRPAANG